MPTVITPRKRVSERIYTPEQILDFFASVQIEKDWSFIEHKPSDTSKLTHCYHRYPAKFIPQLVEKLMDEYLIDIKEPHVNDLFMGSGTTIACAISRGYRASGTDINYISELITKVKSIPIRHRCFGIKNLNLLTIGIGYNNAA